MTIGVVLTSCLNDDKYALDPSGSQNVIEFLDPSVPASPSGAMYPAYSSSFVLAPQDEFELLLSYSGANGNDRDITLTVGVDPSALEEYNHQMHSELHGTEYELMPADNYSIPSTTVVIPAGQKTVSLPIVVYPDKFEFGKNFAVPLRIISASHGILSAHFSVAILSLGVRNEYDGIYDITGGRIARHLAPPAVSPDPALSGFYINGLHINLITLASNRISFAPLWKDGSGIAGIDGTAIQVNGDNSLTFTSSNATLRPKAGAVNSYDPATRTFTINIEWGAGTGLREIFDMKLLWTGPRP